MTNLIFASKLYRASKHKDKIKAALSNPINSELVLQLKEYLDTDELSDLQDGDDVVSKPSESESDASEAKDEKIRPSQTSGSSGGAPMPAPKSDHHLSEQVAEMEEQRDAELNPDTKTFDVQPSESKSDENVEESTQINRASIQASSAVTVVPALSTTLSVDAIIGALNAREDTAGVCRVAIKDSEIWIHYKDTVNLNNVMEPAIALLNASGYGNLDFNRLARTENAIVFTISPNFKPTAPIQGES